MSLNDIFQIQNNSPSRQIKCQSTDSYNPAKQNQELLIQKDMIQNMDVEVDQEKMAVQTKNRCAKNTQLQPLVKGCYTRRIFINGKNVYEFLLILKKQLQVNLDKTKIEIDHSCIYFNYAVKTDKILDILKQSSLNLNIFSSNRAKGTIESFYASSAEFSSLTSSNHSQSNADSNYSSLLSAQAEQVKQLDKQIKQIEFMQQKMSLQQSILGHQCNSANCCDNLIDMVKNHNSLQLRGYLCKKMLENQWNITDLYSYINEEIQDIKLNQLTFSLVAENITHIQNFCKARDYNSYQRPINENQQLSQQQILETSCQEIAYNTPKKIQQESERVKLRQDQAELQYYSRNLTPIKLKQLNENQIYDKTNKENETLSKKANKKQDQCLRQNFSKQTLPF